MYRLKASATCLQQHSSMFQAERMEQDAAQWNKAADTNSSQEKFLKKLYIMEKYRHQSTMPHCTQESISILTTDGTRTITWNCRREIMTEQEALKKLKTCPFCGNQVSIISQKCLNNGFKSYSLFHSTSKCILQGTITDEAYVTLEQLVNKWNKRT